MCIVLSAYFVLIFFIFVMPISTVMAGPRVKCKYRNQNQKSSSKSGYGAPQPAAVKPVQTSGYGGPQTGAKPVVQPSGYGAPQPQPAPSPTRLRLLFFYKLAVMVIVQNCGYFLHLHSKYLSHKE